MAQKMHEGDPLLTKSFKQINLSRICCNAVKSVNAIAALASRRGIYKITMFSTPTFYTKLVSKNLFEIKII